MVSQDVVGLELFVSHKNIQYIKCKASKCGFTQANDLPQYLQIIEDKLNAAFKERLPLCNHYEPATLYISRSEKNPGRPFFKCSGREEECCDYFQRGNTSPSKKTYENWKPLMVENATVTDSSAPKPKKARKNTKDAAAAVFRSLSL